MIGQTLAHYRITERLGEGGMGEVYRARDTKLDRDVAIKVLPERFARDPERLRRFNREARLLASLNHPRIAAAFGLESAGETRFLVLELVPGETLEERIVRGPVPVEESLAIALGIADALEAAHERAIVHRDLKPANVKITPEGQLKVLDFGLAKALVPDPDGDAATQSPTVTSGATATGVVLGTPAYMSPEQARGERVDRRTDIWAFGALVYEMLTGERAFASGNLPETLARVLSAEPDWEALPETTPGTLRRTLRLCLVKDPKARIRDIGDVRLALEGSFEAAAAPPASRRRSGMLGVVAAATLASGLLGVVGAWSLKPQPPRRVVRAQATLPGESLHFGPPEVDVAISSDGRRVLYSSIVGGRRAFRARALDDLEARLVGDGRRVQAPFFSPDGRWIGYFEGSVLRRVPFEGGPATRIGDVPGGRPRGASWGSNDSIVFATSTSAGLWRIPAAGGESQRLTQAEAEDVQHLWPEVLPGGEAVVFTVARGGERSIAVLSLDDGGTRVVVEQGSNPHYAESGHLVFAGDGMLGAVGFDLQQLAATGDPVTVLRNVFTKPSGAANFALSRDGTLVYVPGSREGLARHALVWAGRDGSERILPVEPRLYYQPRLSPEGDRIAITVFDGSNDIWVEDLSRGTSTRITFDPDQDTDPLWSPDGRTLVFSSDREGGVPSLYAKPADGSGREQRLDAAVHPRQPESFSPDGRLLVLSERRPETGLDLLLLSLESGTERKLVATEANESEGRLGPDGRFLAYRSDESGRPEVYVRPFPDVEAGKWQVTTQGGEKPVWARDGEELFYVNGVGRVASVSFRGRPAVSVGSPAELIERDYVADTLGPTFDVAGDGRRLLMLKREGAGDDAEAILVLNWLQEVQRLVPVAR